MPDRSAVDRMSLRRPTSTIRRGSACFISQQILGPRIVSSCFWTAGRTSPPQAASGCVGHSTRLLIEKILPTSSLLPAITSLQVFCLPTQLPQRTSPSCFHNSLFSQLPRLQDYTSLHSAAAGGNVACVRALISAGADVDALDGSGFFGLIISAIRGHAGAVRELLRGGAAVDACEAQGRTALHLSALYDSVDCARVLLAGGADVAARNEARMYGARRRGERLYCAFFLQQWKFCVISNSCLTPSIIVKCGASVCRMAVPRCTSPHAPKTPE